MQTQSTENSFPLRAVHHHKTQDLDHIYQQMQAGKIRPGLIQLIQTLEERRVADPQGWASFTRACLQHPVCAVLHQDPFSHRAFNKPRGYAGDAVMMDMIYGLGDFAQAMRNTTHLGRAIFHYSENSPAKQGVRFRRRLVARLIDQIAERQAPSVLAIAAGHLRELDLSVAAQTGLVREFIAFDQDEESLSVVERDYGHLGVRAVAGSVRQILARKVDLGQYDLVYAAGLFDYLNAQVAEALTRRMFEMTKPGGTLLIPNFLTGVEDRGSMEALMDWYLIYRNHNEMLALTANLPEHEVAEVKVFDDPNSAIVFLQVTKAA